jgi:hypothetical protein
MKKILIINFIFASVLIACYWTFVLFTHGAFVNPIGLFAGCICGFFLMLPLLCCFLVMVIVDFYYLFKFWSEYKLIALLPFLILGLAVISLNVWDVGEMSIKRFKKYQPNYDTFVSKLVKEHVKGKWESIAIPKEYKNLGYWCAVFDDEPNNVYVSFCVGHFGVFGHSAFLFTTSGEINKGSKAAKEWPFRERVNEHWFRVSD